MRLDEGMIASFEILQPGRGEIPGDHYLPARLDTVSWGRLPCETDAAVLRIGAGETVTIDTVSHEGILEDQGKDPHAFFARHGVSADAVLEEEPWFGYYWGPTVPLGKYDMTKVDLGEVKDDVHARNQNADTDNPGVSDFPAAPIVTATTASFQEENPQVFALMENMTFKTDNMSKVLAWKDENNASAEEAAVYYLTNFQDQWSNWLDDSARENLKSVLQDS